MSLVPPDRILDVRFHQKAVRGDGSFVEQLKMIVTK